MVKHAVKKEKDLNEFKNELDDFKADWSENLEELATAQQELSRDNLFETLEYLTYCDELCTAIFLDQMKLDSRLKNLAEIKEKNSQNKSGQNEIDVLQKEFQQLRDEMHGKMESVVEEYYNLYDPTLRKAQDIIQRFAEEMQNEKITPNLKTELRQNLDKELYLQELKDILENYRVAREELISEVLLVSTNEFPDSLIPEDLGEEDPQFDSILSELDSAITACDEALIIKETQD